MDGQTDRQMDGPQTIMPPQLLSNHSKHFLVNIYKSMFLSRFYNKIFFALMLAALDYVAFPNFSLLLKKIFLPRKQILLRATPYWRKTEHGRIAFPESVSLHPEFSVLINLQSVVVNGSPPMLLPFLQMCMCVCVLGGEGIHSCLLPQTIKPFQNVNICSWGLSKLRMQLKLNKSCHQTA